MKIYYTMFLSQSYFTLLLFCVVLLILNNWPSIHLGWHVYKSSTGIRCHPLWLNFSKSLKWCEFFWWTLLCNYVYLCLSLWLIFQYGDTFNQNVVLHMICGIEHCHIEASCLHQDFDQPEFLAPREDFLC